MDAIRDCVPDSIGAAKSKVGCTMLERRSSARHPVTDTVFVTFRPLFDVVGCLIDIGRDGIAIEYTAFEPADRSGLVEVDIFCQPRQVNLTAVPCKIAYDFKIVDAPTFRGFEPHRCGLRFEALDDETREQLDSLVESSAARPSTER